jgi:hypothetical protein
MSAMGRLSASLPFPCLIVLGNGPHLMPCRLALHQVEKTVARWHGPLSCAVSVWIYALGGRCRRRGVRSASAIPVTAAGDKSALRAHALPVGSKRDAALAMRRPLPRRFVGRPSPCPGIFRMRSSCPWCYAECER